MIRAPAGLHPWDVMSEDQRTMFALVTEQKPVAKDATISADGHYRYTLSRHWMPEDETLRTASLAWIMLNPSTADAATDDATIRVCMGRARRLGYSGILVANLYAYRATQPERLWSDTTDPIGALNDFSIATLLDCAKAGDYGAVVCAWGDNAKPARASQVLTRFAAAGVTPYCLGTTKRGAPKHPLRIAYSTPLQVLPVAAASAG